LRLLPAYYVSQAISKADEETAYLPGDLFCQVMAASYVPKKDLELTTSRVEHIKNFQECYLKLVMGLGEPLDSVLKTIQERSAVINHRHRITGDAVTFIVEEIIAVEGKIKIEWCQDEWEGFIDS